MKLYCVRIYVDGVLYSYPFHAPSRRTPMYLQGLSDRDLVLLGGGVLFSQDWCPDSTWGVFCPDKHGVLIPIQVDEQWAPSNYDPNCPDLFGEPTVDEEHDVQFMYSGRQNPA